MQKLHRSQCSTLSSGENHVLQSGRRSSLDDLDYMDTQNLQDQEPAKVLAWASFHELPLMTATPSAWQLGSLSAFYL